MQFLGPQSAPTATCGGATLCADLGHASNAACIPGDGRLESRLRSVSAEQPSLDFAHRASHQRHLAVRQNSAHYHLASECQNAAIRPLDGAQEWPAARNTAAPTRDGTRKRFAFASAGPADRTSAQFCGLVMTPTLLIIGLVRRGGCEVSCVSAAHSILCPLSARPRCISHARSTFRKLGRARRRRPTRGPRPARQLARFSPRCHHPLPSQNPNQPRSLAERTPRAGRNGQREQDHGPEMRSAPPGLICPRMAHTRDT
jgi:hypothetical protein